VTRAAVSGGSSLRGPKPTRGSSCRWPCRHAYALPKYFVALGAAPIFKDANELVLQWRSRMVAATTRGINSPLAVEPSLFDPLIALAICREDDAGAD
jgi:hypothetical protein